MLGTIFAFKRVYRSDPLGFIGTPDQDFLGGEPFLPETWILNEKTELRRFVMEDTLRNTRNRAQDWQFQCHSPPASEPDFKSAFPLQEAAMRATD
jgi:hypothetical protein